VSPIIDFEQTFRRNCGVLLGRGEAGMPEKLLDGTQVRPHVEQVGGIAMSQTVGGNPVDHAGPVGSPPQDTTHVAGIESAGVLPPLCSK